MTMSANCAYTASRQGKSRHGIQLISLFAKLCILTMGLLCPETRANLYKSNLYKSIVYLIRCVPVGLHSPRETPFFF